MKVLFFDMVAPAPYTCNTLRSYAMGGSEASLLRVARGLAKEGLEVAIFQAIDAGRTEMVIDGILHLNEHSNFEPDIVVHMRTSLAIEEFKKEFPKARHIVWLHDAVSVPEDELAGQEVVCVSDWHKEQVSKTLEAFKLSANVKRIYNPVEIDGHRYDKVEGRLGFFSSPHKGLDQVVSAFKQVGRLGRELVIANPGYMPDAGVFTSHVVNLGQLNHARTLEEMSKCQVLFQVQTCFPETFGLVMAEAEAMGVPVLAHAFGAAKEVCGPYSIVVDCTKPENVEAALEELLAQKEKPVADPRFKLETIIAEWRALLES